MLACRDHEFGRTSSDPTIGSCWDANRLDLDRVGVDTNPSLHEHGNGKAIGLAAALPETAVSWNHDGLVGRVLGEPEGRGPDRGGRNGCWTLREVIR